MLLPQRPGGYCYFVSSKLRPLDERLNRRRRQDWSAVRHRNMRYYNTLKIRKYKTFLRGLVLSGCLGSLMFLVVQNDHTGVHTRANIYNNKEVTETPVPPEPCHPVTKIAFLKVHKAGSSTVANILQRFGYTRNLNFVVPKKKLHKYGYNYIGMRGDIVSTDDILPLPPGETYDILWNHVTYDHDAFREIMPFETRYVSILRERFHQFVSAFEYYRNARVLNGSNPLADYLDKKDLFDKPLMNHFRNSQSSDMGFQPLELTYKSFRMDYISQLSEDFDLVMLMEYFDESLVLMKRILCWNIKDILYFPHNKNSHKKQRHFRQDNFDKQKVLSSADYDLYDHFSKVFWDKVWNEGPGFFEEVRYFKTVLHQLRDHCFLQKSLVVPASEWDKGFTVNTADCKYLQMSELGFYDKIWNTTYEKLHLHHLIDNETFIYD